MRHLAHQQALRHYEKRRHSVDKPRDTHFHRAYTHPRGHAEHQDASRHGYPGIGLPHPQPHIQRAAGQTSRSGGDQPGVHPEEHAPPAALLAVALDPAEQQPRAHSAGSHRRQQVAHLLLRHQREEDHRRRHPYHSEHQRPVAPHLAAQHRRQQRRRRDQRPHARLRRVAPVIPPRPHVMVDPCPRLLMEHRRGHLRMRQIDVDIPPGAHRHHRRDHRRQTPAVARRASRPPVKRACDQEREQQREEGHRPLAEKRQAHHHPAGRELPDPPAPADGVARIVEREEEPYGPLHPGMAVDVPGGSASHQDHTVAGEEDEAGDHRRVVAARHGPHRQVEEERP